MRGLVRLVVQVVEIVLTLLGAWTLVGIIQGTGLFFEHRVLVLDAVALWVGYALAMVVRYAALILRGTKDA